MSIVGRDRELALVREAIDGLAGGGRALLIEGDAGIGKTAVWRAAYELAGRALVCVADEADARLSFAGLADLLRDVADEVLPALPGPQREALEVAIVRRASASGRPPDPMAAGFALRTVLAELASDGPLVIAVDDAQWLDAATARALAFATRRLQDRPVGVVATVRSPLAAADPLGLERAFGERLQRVRLGGLGMAPLGAILAARHGRPCSRPTLRRIVRASGGNPLYALEIARALGPSPALAPGAPLPIPDSLTELVAARVAGVGPAARGALLAAAALSHPRVALVERAASAAGLLAAEDAGLVRVTADRVRFLHPLYASAIYTAAASGRRRELHARLAELVEDTEERVRHLALAAAAPDEAVAAALVDAAAGARARGAWDAAGELLEQASTLTPLEDRARERAVRAAEHHIHAGDRPRARALLERLLEREPAGPRRADALRLLSSIRYHEDSFADAARLLDEALDHASDPSQAVPIELGACHLRCHLGDLEAADAHAARAVALARRLGGGPRLGEALAVRTFVDLVLARVPDWSDVERALALEDGTRLLPLELRPSMLAAQLAAYSGRPEEARRRLESVRAGAAATGDESDLAHILCWLVWVETLDGELARACALADEALGHAVLTGSEANRAWVLAHRSLARAHRGDAGAALADAADAAAIAAGLGYPLPLVWTATAVAVLELSRGNPAAAWDAAAPVRGPARRRRDDHRVPAAAGGRRLDRAGRAGARGATARTPRALRVRHGVGRGRGRAARRDAGRRARRPRRRRGAAYARARSGDASVRARPDAAGGGPRPPPPAPQARGPRVALAGARAAGGHGRAAVGRPRPRRARPRQSGPRARGADRLGAPRRAARRRGPLEQADRERAVDGRPHGRGAPVAHLREARRRLARPARPSARAT